MVSIQTFVSSSIFNCYGINLFTNILIIHHAMDPTIIVRDSLDGQPFIPNNNKTVYRRNIE